MKIIKAENILLEFVEERDEVLHLISNKAVELGYATDDVFNEFIARENEFSTAFGNGIAIPHAKSSKVTNPGIFVLRNREAIHWVDEEVNLVIAIVTPEGGANTHLRLLSQLSRKLMHAEFRQALLKADNEEELLSVMGLEQEEL